MPLRASRTELAARRGQRLLVVAAVAPGPIGPPGSTSTTSSRGIGDECHGLLGEISPAG